MTTDEYRPWWAHTKAKQKREIEDAVEWYLSRDGELTDRQKLLLRDAIGHAYRGLFGLAAEDIYELGFPESAWSPSARVDPVMVEGVSRETLQRALNALKASTAQSRPIFG
jgi:hypothetical protein